VLADVGSAGLPRQAFRGLIVMWTLDYAVLGLQKRVFLMANLAQSSGRETANGKTVGQW
jgi:hypothetical protein